MQLKDKVRITLNLNLHVSISEQTVKLSKYQCCNRMLAHKRPSSLTLSEHALHIQIRQHYSCEAQLQSYWATVYELNSNCQTVVKTGKEVVLTTYLLTLVWPPSPASILQSGGWMQVRYSSECSRSVEAELKGRLGLLGWGIKIYPRQRALQGPGGGLRATWHKEV